MGNASGKIAIRLENTAEAGKNLKGRVYLSIPRGGLQNIRSLNLKFEGEEDTTIVTNEKNDVGRNRKTFDRATCIIFEMEVPLKIYSSGVINGGQYEYPFEWPLPADLPSSMIYRQMTGGTSCQIKYRIKAYLTQIHETDEFPSSYLFTSDVVIHGASSLEYPGQIMKPLEIFPMKSCFIKYGSISLGVDIDTSIIAPNGAINVGIAGKNDSMFTIKNFIVRIVENVTCFAAGRSCNFARNLSCAKVLTPTNEVWDSISKKTSKKDCRSTMHRNNINLPDETQLFDNRFVTRLILPRDALDTYRGNTIEISHILIVELVTSFSYCVVSPEVSIELKMQRQMPTIAPIETPIVPSAPPMFLDDQNAIESHITPLPVPHTTEIPIAEAQLLSGDWNAQESEVIHIIAVEDMQQHQPSTDIAISSNLTAKPPPSAPPEKLIK